MFAPVGMSTKRSKGVMGSGKVSAMLNQWSSVKRSLQEEEEEQARKEAEAQDPEVSVSSGSSSAKPVVLLLA